MACLCWISDFTQLENQKEQEMVIHSVQTDLRKPDIEVLKGELCQDTPSLHLSNNSFQQVRFLKVGRAAYRYGIYWCSDVWNSTDYLYICCVIRRCLAVREEYVRWHSSRLSWCCLSLSCFIGVMVLKRYLNKSCAEFQVLNVSRSLTSPASTPDHQRIPQTTVDNKLLPTPPAYAPSPLNVAATAAAAAATGNFPAAVAAAAAAQTANPFLLAAALGLQQQQQTLPWISNAQSFTAMLPYLQQLQAQAQQAQAQITQVNCCSFSFRGGERWWV